MVKRDKVLYVIETDLSLMPFLIPLCPHLQKILTMIPTEEEKQKIQEAQLANPDVPLGSAEQFLLTLSSISELSARLQLWAFKLDYEATEKVCITHEEALEKRNNNVKY